MCVCGGTYKLKLAIYSIYSVYLCSIYTCTKHNLSIFVGSFHKTSECRTLNNAQCSKHIYIA